MSKHVKIEGQQDGNIKPFSIDKDPFVSEAIPDPSHDVEHFYPASNPVPLQPEYVGKLKVEPKEIFEGGATRSDSRGKGRFDLIPYRPLKRLALRYEEGGIQHGDNNWKNGQPSERICAAIIRHTYQWMDGERDEDHLAAAAWNLFALMYFEDKDDD